MPSSPYLPLVARVRYTVDLGKDPVHARKRLQELQSDEFLGLNTRRATISFTVFNNALPMFCFMRLVFDVSPTGQFSSDFVVEAMNVQEYIADTFALQMLLETVLLMWTILQVHAPYLALHLTLRYTLPCFTLFPELDLAPHLDHPTVIHRDWRDPLRPEAGRPYRGAARLLA